MQDSINAIAAAINVQPAKIGQVLERRAVENYIDLDALQSWLKSELVPGVVSDVLATWKQANGEGWCKLSANIRGESGTKRRALFATLALEQTSERIRKFFDFTRGRGEATKLRTVDSVWSELSELQQSALEHGFSKSVLREFYSSPKGKTDSAARAELQQIITSIQERQ